MIFSKTNQKKNLIRRFRKKAPHPIVGTNIVTQKLFHNVFKVNRGFFEHVKQCFW